MRKLVVLLLSLLLAGGILAACAAGPNYPGVYVVPQNLPHDCSSDVTSSLNSELSALPSNTIVQLYAGACYEISSALTIRDKTNITINGNGATFKLVNPTATTPIINLWHDSGVTSTGLTLSGSYTGSNAGNEGMYGVVLEGDTNITFRSDTIENTQGDWVYLSPPYDVNKETDQLNTGITFTDDTFLNAGYHGFTIESAGCPTSAACNGLTVQNSTMTNVYEDAMDFEYDTYSTGFQDSAGGCTPTASNATTCLPFWAAQDYVTITNNTWNGWGGSDWLASIQGQAPGVRFQHLTVTGNTLNDNAPFMEVEGTQAGVTTPAYLNSSWTVTGNRYGPGFYARSYRGGGSADTELENISDLTLSNNNLPDCPGGNSPACDGSLTHYAVQGFGLSGNVKQNNMLGNLGVFQPYASGTGNTAALCGNTIGPTATPTLDAACPAARHAPVPSKHRVEPPHLKGG